MIASRDHTYRRDPLSQFEAGPNQRFVTYYSEDSGGEVDTEAFVAAIAEDADRRKLNGWRLLSSSLFPLRQVGTAGNMLFQSGGQMATMLTAVVVYVRDF
jgi:hypothetical protein